MPMKIYLGGTYDIIHPGHIFQFRILKEMFPNCHLVIALNTDEFIEQYKGKKPIFSYKERERFLKSIVYIDEIIPNESGADSKPTILKVKPNIIAIGNDWLERNYPKQMDFTATWLTEQQITLIFLPLLEGISNTEIKKRVRE